MLQIDYSAVYSGESPQTDSAKTATPSLQQLIEDSKRGAEVYQRYQQNAAKAAVLKADILRGTREGENICTLFLKASEALALATDDAVFQRTVEGNISSVYADALHNGEALDVQIERARKELKLLENAAESAVIPEEKRRLVGSVEAYKAKIARLTVRLIDKG